MPPPVPTYSIGGTVTGLAGTGLVLRNNGGNDLAIAASGAFTFTTQLTNGGSYSVTTAAQPTNVSQTCEVANGAGTVAGANVANVTVTCTTNAFPVSAAVSGLAGSGLVLISNGGDNVAVGSNGTVQFASQVLSGAVYDVRVLTQPAGPLQTCTVSNGSNVVANAAVQVGVSCVTEVPRYAYSLDSNDESISIYGVDASTGMLRARGHARTGAQPVDGVGDPGDRFVYVLNRGAASVSAFTKNPFNGDLTEIAGSPYATGAASGGASRISMHPSGRFLYVTNNGGPDNIAGFAIDATSGALTAIGGSPFATGTFPTHFSIDGRGHFGYVVNRDSNDIYVYQIDATSGALSEVAGGRIAAGTNPLVLTLHRNGRFAFVPNAGSADMSVFTVNATTGLLTPVAGSAFAVGTNPAPTPLFDPSGRFLYVMVRGALNATGSVAAFSIDQSTGVLTPIGAPSTGVNSNAFWMDGGGRFIYVANRGVSVPGNSVGSISAFGIDASSGVLTALTGIPSLQPAPYTISVDPSGKFAYSASAESNLLYSFAVNTTSGELTPLAHLPVQVSRDQPISLAAYSSMQQPTAATFRSRFGFVPNTGGNSLSSYSIAAASGSLSANTPVASGSASPVSLALHRNGQYVFSLNAGAPAAIATHRIDATSGVPSAPTNSLPTGGTAPASLLVSPSGSASYFAQTIVGGTNPSIIGSLSVSGATGVVSPVTTPPNALATPSPALAVAVPPSGRAVYAITNDSWRFGEINRASGGFAGTNGGGAIPTGALGKRALVFHPSGRFAYVAIGANPGSIEVYGVRRHTPLILDFNAALTATSGSTPVSIAIDPTGRFLYVANSGDGTVSMFSISHADGALTSIAGAVATGANPTSIAVDYSGSHAYVVDQTEANVRTYAIDQTTGALSLSADPPAPTGTNPGAIVLSTDVQ